MSPTYSRNSRPCIKNIVISLFSTVFGSVCRMLRFRTGKRGAMSEEARWDWACLPWGGGCRIGWRMGRPHSDRLSLSVLAAVTASCP